VQLQVPPENSAVIARLHAVGEVVECDYTGPEVLLKVRIQPHHRSEFQPFVTAEL